MKISAVFLLFLGAFFGLIGLVYWFWSYEDGGGVMLLGATLLGFLPGSYYFFWYRRYHGHKYFFVGKITEVGDAADDREDAEVTDGAGEHRLVPRLVHLALRAWAWAPCCSCCPSSSGSGWPSSPSRWSSPR